MNRFEALVSRGYFPSQLPPPFKTSMLAEHLEALKVDWKIGQKNSKAPLCKPELFSVARTGHKRRVTSLVNPVAQVFLAASIAAYWGGFLKKYRKSKLSCSRPRFVSKGRRAACLPNMQKLSERKIELSAGFKFALRTDISRFFPTIYTHSIPWCLHGKSVSKRHRSSTPEYFGNIVDEAVRQGQHGQTMGLPIGPDTSHIIAEAIAVEIDELFCEKVGIPVAGFRYVDDYFLFFPTISDAESALASLSGALQEYELQINFEKTHVGQVFNLIDDYWTHQLRSFEFRSAVRPQKFDINHFFELSKELAQRYSDENVMAYALKRVSSEVIRRENWAGFEAHLCHVALAYPNTLQTVSRILATYRYHGYPIGKSRIARLVKVLIQDHAPLGHHFEVAWCLWIAKQMGVVLGSQSVDQVSQMHSSVCALLLLDMADQLMVEGAIKWGYWERFFHKESLFEDLWLLSYEATVRGWRDSGGAVFSKNLHFQRLNELGVRFYDLDARESLVFDLKEGVLDRLNLTRSSDLFDREDAADFVEFDEEDSDYQSGVFSTEVFDDDADLSVSPVDDDLPF